MLTAETLDMAITIAILESFLQLLLCLLMFLRKDKVSTNYIWL